MTRVIKKLAAAQLSCALSKRGDDFHYCCFAGAELSVPEVEVEFELPEFWVEDGAGFFLWVLVFLAGSVSSTITFLRAGGGVAARCCSVWTWARS